MRLLKSLLLPILLAASCAIAAGSEPTVVNLRHKDHFDCTGWAVNTEKALWVTAGHCLDEDVLNDGGLSLPNGTKLTVVKIDSVADIALLQGGLQREALSISKFPPKGLDEVYAIGYTGDSSELRYRFFVISPSTKLTDFPVAKEVAIYQGLALAGTSGAPILNKRNEVVGIVNGGYQRGGTVAWGTRWLDLKAFLQGFVQSE